MGLFPSHLLNMASSGSTISASTRTIKLQEPASMQRTVGVGVAVSKCVTP